MDLDPDHGAADLTRLCEQLARRLQRDGADHPGAAALTLAVRGLQRADPASFAAWLGISPLELGRIEAGEVALADLPPPILAWAEADPRLDLDRLG